MRPEAGRGPVLPGRPPPPADLLLGHALFMALDPKQVERMKPYPPLGTLYAAARLRADGWRVDLFDAMLEPGPAAFGAALDRAKPRLVALVEDHFNFFAKMCLARMREAALDMIGQARARGLPVLVAGPDASDAPEIYLAAGAAAVLAGEPEHALAEAAAALLGTPGAGGSGPPAGARGGLNGSLAGSRDASAALAQVPGLILPIPGESTVRRNPARAPERRPDRFPWPAWDLVDVEAYRRRWTEAHGFFSINMVSTRGCPFHCNWCAKPTWGQRYAMRSPEDVAAEMAWLRRSLAPDHVWFADDIFGLRPEWTAAFGSAVAAKGAGLPFMIQSRVDLITEPAAQGLARAGCAEVWLGVESGSQRVLDAMEKGIRLADLPGVVARLRALGIRVGFFLQLGYPGEDWADILATRDLVRDLLPEAIGVSVSYPLPGTAFHARVADQLGARRNWRDSRDLAMLFQGRYQSDFYRRLHTLLHADHDARRAEADLRRRGQDPAPAAAERAAVEARWAELAALEPRSRAAAPTELPLRAAAPAPDLSRPAN